MRPSVDRLVLAEEGKEPEGAPEEDEEDEPEEFAEPAAAGSTMKLSSKPIERVRFSLNVVFWKWLSSTDSTCCDVVGPSLKTSLDMVLCVESGWRRKLRRGALVGAVALLFSADARWCRQRADAWRCSRKRRCHGTEKVAVW